MRKLFVRVLAAIALTVAAVMPSLAQESFAYQAVIRDAKGELITNKEVGLRFSLMNGGKAYYVETQKAVTNQYGNISVEIGKGTKVGDGGFADVPWNTLDITLKVEVDVNGGTNYILLGETKISPAPYAMYATTGGGVAKVAGASKDNGSLFEVADCNGNVVFAVTSDGIVVYVDDSDLGDKARRSGFLVRGRTATKDQPATEYFSVTTEGTHIYVDNSEFDDKARRSGFLVRGRTATKDDDAASNYMAIDSDGTHIYVDNDSDKARRSGFLVRGRTATKDEENTVFSIDGALTTVYVDDSDSYRDDKARRSGFLVRGRTATKGETVDYVTVNNDSTLLNTQSLMVAAPGDSSITMQMLNGQLYLNGDMIIDGEVRRWMDLEMTEAFSFYMSDLGNREGFDNDEFESSELYDSLNTNYTKYNIYAFGVNNYRYDIDNIYYYDEDDNYHGHSSSCRRLATINEKGLLLPCLPDGIILFDINGKETRTLDDAVVMLYLEYSYNLKLWPLKALTDYRMTFALINDYYFNGYATQYERYDFVVNSQYAYAGSCFSPVAQSKYDPSTGYYYDEYDVKITSGGEDYEFQVIDNDAGAEVRAVFGSTVTLEALTAPEGKLFDYWMKKKYSSDDYGVPYYSNPLEVTITNVDKVYFEARFKDIPPIWVDGQNGNDETGDGDKKPFKTINRALQYIAQNGNGSGYRIATRNYEGDIAVGTNIDDEKASLIIIDFGQNRQENGGTTTGQHVIDITTTVPVTISNGTFSRISTDRAINVAAGSKLTLDNCTVKGSNDSENPAAIGGAMVGEEGTLTLTSSTIMNFSANNGGGVYLDGGELCLDGKSSNNSTIRGCKTIGTGNTKGMGGGVYATNGGKVTFVEYGYVQDNEAKNGGGIYLTDNATIEFINEYYSYITGNKASNNGGGLFIDEGISLTLDNYNYITSNSAQYGGGVYVSQDASLDQAGAYINSNTASKNGGGVYVAGSLSISNNSTIGDYFRENLGNTCVTGAGVYVDANAIFNMNGGQVNYNHSDKSNPLGGGVYVASDGQFIMTAGQIYNNKASLGAGVYLEENALFTAESNVYSSNETNANAVYVKEGATFNIKGNAYFGSGSYANTIFLDGDAMINVTGNLTSQYSSTAVAIIKLETNNYQQDKQVVTSDGLSSNYSRIAVEKQIVTNTFGASMPVEWTINNDGKLQKKAVESGTDIDGALDGLFKVSDNKIIRFSQGNLQYLANDGNGMSKWQFAENQTDAISDDDNKTISQTSEKWINLFGYGTSGWYSGAQEYQPYTCNDESINYLQASMTGPNANADWGVYNAIYNGGNTHGMWRTLTTEEWNYLFFGRGGTEAESKKRFAEATIICNSYSARGVIILPDNWKITTSDLSAAGIHNFLTGNQGNGSETGYAVNVLTSDQWEFMERNGAVFLPADGYRDRDHNDNVYIVHYGGNGATEITIGHYWTADNNYLYFSNGELHISTDNTNLKSGRSVRLVTDVSDATIDGSASKHEYVDLKLPSGKKWAKINLGFDEIYRLQNNKPLKEDDAYATTESFKNGSTKFSHGYRYAWGDPEAKTTFNGSNYKYYSGGKYTKYNDEDGLNVLELEDDPAYMAWGGNWRTPTDEDWKELFENCYWAVARANSNSYEYNSWAVHVPSTGDKNRHYNGYNSHACYVPEGWSTYDCGTTSGNNSQIAARRPKGTNYNLYGSRTIIIPMSYPCTWYNYAEYYTSVLDDSGLPYFIKLGAGDYDYRSFNVIRQTVDQYASARYDYGFYIRPIWIPNTSTVFYVSDEGNDDNNDGTRLKPFKTIQQAASKMTDKYTRYTIFVVGELSDAQTLTGTIKARQITLRGANGLNNLTGLPNDKIIGGITINATYNAANGNAKPLPVVVENLEINNGDGVAVTVGENAKVTFTSGAVVSKTEVNGTFTLKNDASAENVVLGAGKTITVDGSFNGAQVTVTPAEYTENTPVLTIPDGVTVPDDSFIVAPEQVVEPDQWTIDENGLLQKVI